MHLYFITYTVHLTQRERGNDETTYTWKHQVINCESERACQTHGRLYIVVRPLAELCITCMLKHQHVK